MDRLLSCYIDKLLNNAQYFTDAATWTAEDSFPYRVKQRARQLIKNKTNDDNMMMMPTFEEFLEFVLSTQSFDGILIIFNGTTDLLIIG